MRGMERMLAKLTRQAAATDACALRARDESAQEALEKARQLAPVRTGRLKSSIRREEGRVYTTLSYAGAVEWGSRYVPPRPYLLPAADMRGYREKAQQLWKEAML